MNNKTIEEVKIKMRGDHVYDVYVNGNWISSKGSYLSAFAAAMEEIDIISRKDEE